MRGRAARLARRVPRALSIRRNERASRVLRMELDLLADLGALAGLALERRRRREITDADTDAELGCCSRPSPGDPYTSEHADDVVDLARWVGGELAGLTRSTLHELELTAALHDMGKMRVPARSCTRRARSTRRSAR